MIYKIFAYCLLAIGVIGFFLNLLVIILLLHSKQTNKHVNFTLLNLIISDFAVSLIGAPINVTAAFSGYWAFSHKVCVFYGFIMALLGIVSITTLSTLSFLRYLLILNPLHSVNFNLKKYVFFIIIGIWMYSLILTTPPLLGWGEYGYEGLNISCSINWESRDPKITSYIVFLFAFGFFIPVSVILFSYYNVLKLMKKNAKTFRGKVAQVETKVTFMVFTMIASFLFAWSPYAVVALLKQFAFNYVHISPELASIPALVAKSSICYNPIIYVFMNRQLLQSIKKKYERSRTAYVCSISYQRRDHTKKSNTKIEITVDSEHVDEVCLTEI